ncbi:MAG: hypothetical protein HFF58_04580 [Lawsonibacter sp.]|jgi:cytochrome c oxidase subunit 4|nr:hypothetical protein [Lawsonibacter sp.]
MDYGMLNLGSILLGLAGWAIPIIQIGRLLKEKRGFGRYTHILSMGACALAIWCQIRYNEYLIDIEDWGAIVDTIDAVRKVALFLLVTTLVVNLVTAHMENALDKEET